MQFVINCTKSRSKCYLDVHKATIHEEKKPFKFDICDSMYTVKHNLDYQISLVHEGKKPYKCDILT